MSDEQTTPAQAGPFDLKANNGGIVGTITIYPSGASMVFDTPGPFGREDLRAIARRLMNIADYDSGLRE